MKLSSDFRLFDVAGQSLLLYTGGKSVDANAAYALNGTAAWLIKKIGEQDFTEEHLVQWLLEEYDVTEELASADVSALMELLRTHAIIVE